MEAAHSTPPAKGAGQKGIAAFFSKGASSIAENSASGDGSSAKKAKHVEFSTPVARDCESGENLEISPSNKPAAEVVPVSILRKNDKENEAKKPANKRKQAAKGDPKAPAAKKRGGGRKKQKAEEPQANQIEALVDLTGEMEAPQAASEPATIAGNADVQPVVDEPTITESKQDVVAEVSEAKAEVEMEIPEQEEQAPDATESQESSQNEAVDDASQNDAAAEVPEFDTTAATDDAKAATRKRKRSPKAKPVQLSPEEIEATMPEDTLAKLKLTKEKLQTTLRAASEADSTISEEVGQESDREIELQAALATAVAAEPVVSLSENGDAEENPEGAASLAAIPPSFDAVIARAIQGSAETLSQVTERIVQMFSEALEEDSPNRATATNHVVIAEKIKSLARRTNHGNKMTAQIAILDDQSEAMIWRWEVHSLDHFPAQHHDIVREKRRERVAFGRTVQALTSIIDMMYKPEPSESKIQAQEDKVAKAQLELQKIAEKRHARVQKIAEKLQKEAEKRQKEEEKKRKEEEKEAKKLEAEEARKRKKEEEEQKKLQLDEKTKKKHEVKLKQSKEVEAQRSSLMSFLKTPGGAAAAAAADTGDATPSSPSSPLSAEASGTTVTTAPDDATEQATVRTVAVEPVSVTGAVHRRVDPAVVAHIDTSINTNVPLSTLMQERKQQLKSKPKSCKKRRPRWIDEQVQARVSAGTSGFNTIEYVELRTVRLCNKMKYLHFCEDHRPPYLGTFSKRSTILNGRRHGKKDEEIFNYDYDSEAEWEEEEEGEDLGESEDGDEEPADDLMYDEFFCKDDDLGSDAGSDVDDMRVVNKRRSQPQSTEPVVIPPRFVVSPTRCLVPTIEGLRSIDLDDHARVLTSVRAIRIAPKKICVGVEVPADPAPSAETELEKEEVVPGTTEAEGGENAGAQQRTKLEDCHIPDLAELIHGSTISKEKLIEEFKLKYPTLPKLQIKKKIEEIANKHKPINGGTPRWVVHREVLESFNLDLTLPAADPKVKAPRKRKAKAVVSTENSGVPPGIETEPNAEEAAPTAPSTPVGQKKLGTFFQRSERKADTEVAEADRGWAEEKQSEPVERLPDDFCVIDA